MLEYVDSNLFCSWWLSLINVNVAYLWIVLNWFYSKVREVVAEWSDLGDKGEESIGNLLFTKPESVSNRSCLFSSWEFLQGSACLCNYFLDLIILHHSSWLIISTTTAEWNTNGAFFSLFLWSYLRNFSTYPPLAKIPGLAWCFVDQLFCALPVAETFR